MESVSPFANLPELPCDVAEVLEQFKLAIIRHRSMDWGMIGQEEMMDVCRALLRYVEGDSKSPTDSTQADLPLLNRIDDRMRVLYRKAEKAAENSQGNWELMYRAQMMGLLDARNMLLEVGPNQHD